MKRRSFLQLLATSVGVVLGWFSQKPTPDRNMLLVDCEGMDEAQAVNQLAKIGGGRPAVFPPTTRKVLLTVEAEDRTVLLQTFVPEDTLICAKGGVFRIPEGAIGMKWYTNGLMNGTSISMMVYERQYDDAIRVCEIDMSLEQLPNGKHGWVYRYAPAEAEAAAATA